MNRPKLYFDFETTSNPNIKVREFKQYSDITEGVETQYEFHIQYNLPTPIYRRPQKTWLVFCHTNTKSLGMEACEQELKRKK